MFDINLASDEKVVEIKFGETKLCNVFFRLEFCSRLLHSLQPGLDDATWRPTTSPRVNAHILGLPSRATWERLGAKRAKGIFDTAATPGDIDAIRETIRGLEGSKPNEFQNKETVFSIVDNSNDKIFSYKFLSSSRPIVALCVLWDSKPHPRDHLEITRDPSVAYSTTFPPKLARTTNEKTYGDPSKMVDELRCQGFPIDTDQSPRGIYIKTTKDIAYGTSQTTYTLVNKNQSMLDRVTRSTIPEYAKKTLFKISDQYCNNCGQQFSEEYLAPDHRVPSIVKLDDLNADNYMEVLQTLCVNCNQVKRESCKKCPYSHDCNNCHWAFPEKHGVSTKNLKLLKSLAAKNDISINELLHDTFGSRP